MAIPTFRWTLTKPETRQGVGVPAMLKEWHRAGLLGSELERLEIDGKAVDPATLARLRYWIAAGGAWNAVRQNYFEGWARLDRVIKSEVDVRSRRGRGRLGDLENL